MIRTGSDLMLTGQVARKSSRPKSYRPKPESCALKFYRVHKLKKKMLTQLCPGTYANVKLNKDANIAVHFERHDYDMGHMTPISGDMTFDLAVNRLNKSNAIKFRAFCLFMTTGYLFSLKGGILNVESVSSASGE